MIPERLSNILAAYGARPERWPVAERAAALTLIAAQPALASSVAAEARLDAMLDSDKIAAAHGALVGQIMASAPRRRTAARWWAGLGFASAGLAGVLAGAVLLPMVAPQLLESRSASWVDDQPTLFTPVAGEEKPS